MREFIYYSSTAPTKGNFSDDLMKAGRLDIAIHSVIASLFLSHTLRTDTKIHLVFAGAPDPVKHLEFMPETKGQTGKDKIYLSKKDVAGVIKKLLYKYKEGEKREVFPGYWIEKKALAPILKEKEKEGKHIYILDKSGESLRDIKIEKNPVFLLGDHKGLPDMKKELKRIPHTKVSVGKKTYFASQTISIVNNELDLREEKGEL